MEIDSGSISIILLTREPNEPYSAEPTVEVSKRIKLVGKKLVEIK